MTNKEKKDINEEFGTTNEEYTKMALEVEHLLVDYKITALSEADLIKKLLPDIEPRDQLKVLYFGRCQWWQGHDTAKRDP